MDTKVCYLFGAGEQSPCHIELGKDDLVIAVDGGFNYLEKIGCVPTMCLVTLIPFRHPAICHPTASATQKKKMIRT